MIADNALPIASAIPDAQLDLLTRPIGHYSFVTQCAPARVGYLRRALEAGVAGYLLKDRPSAELADAVRRVHAGDRAIDPELAADAWNEHNPLSERKRTVLRLAEDGSTSATIAMHLSLSEGTVRNYLSEAIGKVGAANRTVAARLARERGWL